MSLLADIRAIGFVTPASGDLAEAAPAILQNECFYIRHPEFVGADGMQQTGGYVESCMNERDVAERLVHLFEQAFEKCVATLPDDIPADATFPMVLAIPGWLDYAEDIREQLLRTLQDRNFARLGKLYLVPGEHAAGFEALSRAAGMIRDGKTEMAFAAAIDTLVAPIVLDARAYQGKANTQDNPYGVIPSEAGVVMLLSREGMGEKAPILRLRGIGLGQENEKLDDPDRGILGTALAECLHVAQQDLGVDPKIGAFVSDVNAERHRSEELGVVLTKISSGNETFTDPLTPALSIGDVGAATGLVYAALVPYMTEISAPHILIATSSDTGLRAAACLDQVT